MYTASSLDQPHQVDNIETALVPLRSIADELRVLSNALRRNNHHDARFVHEDQSFIHSCSEMLQTMCNQVLAVHNEALGTLWAGPKVASIRVGTSFILVDGSDFREDSWIVSKDGKAYHITRKGEVPEGAEMLGTVLGSGNLTRAGQDRMEDQLTSFDEESRHFLAERGIHS